MSARVTKVSLCRMRWMGSELPFAFLMADLRASAEKTTPLTAMIFWPGASLALSAGPGTRACELAPSGLTRVPVEDQTVVPAAGSPPGEAVGRSGGVGVAVWTGLY